MALKKIEFLEDRIRIDYNLRKPIGIRDVSDSMEISYDNICKLPDIPK